MPAILAITLPFFALVLLGYLSAWQRLLPLEAVPGLNAFVLRIALPCLLFRCSATRPVAELLDPVVLAVYLLCALVMVAFTIAMTLSARLPLKDAAFGALVAAIPNTGGMGLALLTALAGPGAAGPVLAGMLIDLFVTRMLCIGLAQHRRPRGVTGAHDSSLHSHLASTAWLMPHPAPTGSPLRRALGEVLRHPLPWAIGLGALASAQALTLPAPLAFLVTLLADAASPVALFTIGAICWRARLATPAGLADSDAARDAPPSTLVEERARIALPKSMAALLQELPVALIKLLLHPLLMLLIGLGPRALGATRSSFQLTMLVLTAALPSASHVALLSEHDPADNDRLTRIILISTVLAAGTFSVIAWGVGLPPGT